MSGFLAALSGMTVMLVTFVGGALTAVFLLASEPVQDRKLDLQTSDLWTDRPITVKPHPADLKRVPARAASTLSSNGTGRQQDHSVDALTDTSPAEFGNDFVSDPDPEFVDPMTTAAVPKAAEQGQPISDEEAQMQSGHATWCSDRYRSYRPEDNTYTSYSGARRECISPYSGSSDEVGGYIEASVTGGIAQSGSEFSSDHIESCFARYRSYRPEDNSYQPYSGGPRRQCE